MSEGKTDIIKIQSNPNLTVPPGCRGGMIGTKEIGRIRARTAIF
nr:MAG TPA_asm: hypothetical protein [Caudoviricetes sp.]